MWTTFPYIGTCDRTGTLLAAAAAATTTATSASASATATNSATAIATATSTTTNHMSNSSSKFDIATTSWLADMRSGSSRQAPSR